MTDATPSRRDLQRQATMNEIVTTARSLVARSQEISLRAVASAMGMTAPALYRYVDSLEDLSLRVAANVYDDLLAVMTKASAPYAPDPARQMVAGCAAFRRWALANRGEFALTFANPITGVISDSDSVCATAGRRFGAFFGIHVVALWNETHFTVPTDDELADVAPMLNHLDDSALAAMHAEVGMNEVPVGVHWTFIRAWSRLYGSVTLEVFGHVEEAIVESGAVFRDMLSGCGELLGLDKRNAELQQVVTEVLS